MKRSFRRWLSTFVFLALPVPLAHADGVSCASDQGACASDCQPDCCMEPICDDQVFNDCWGDACACQPLWTVRAGAIFLDRSTPNGGQIAEATLTGDTLLDSSDFDLGVHSGFDFYARRTLASGRSAEFRYFDIDGWQAGSSNFVPLLANIGGAVVGLATGIESTYDTNLKSAEFNINADSDSWWTVQAGVRYLSVDEQMHNTFDFLGLQIVDYDADTSNDLFGFQVGLNGILLQRGRFTLDGYGKAGIYYNDVTRSTQFQAFIGPPVGVTYEESDNTAFVGDIGLNLNFKVTQHVALRGGYQVLFVDGVAEASAQGPAVAGNPINDHGNLFYHGATAAVELTW